MKRKGSQQQEDQHRTQEESENESRHQTQRWRVEQKHLNTKRQLSSIGAYISKNKKSQQPSDIKENESQRRSDVSDYQEESPHQGDIKEAIVDGIEHQKVFNVNSADIRVIDLVTADRVRLMKHIGAHNHIDHLMSDSIPSEISRIAIMIESMQHSFTNKRYITSKNHIEKIAQDNFDITLHVKSCVKNYSNDIMEQKYYIKNWQNNVDIIKQNYYNKNGYNNDIDGAKILHQNGYLNEKNNEEHSMDTQYLIIRHFAFYIVDSIDIAGFERHFAIYGHNDPFTFIEVIDTEFGINIDIGISYLDIDMVGYIFHIEQYKYIICIYFVIFLNFDYIYDNFDIVHYIYFSNCSILSL